MRTHRNRIRPLGNICLRPFSLRFLEEQLRDAPSDGHRSSFAFPGRGGSTGALAIQDQIDVGLSDPLQTGLGFFDPLHAVCPGPALRSACPGTARAGSIFNGFSMFRDHHRTVRRAWFPSLTSEPLNPRSYIHLASTKPNHPSTPLREIPDESD